MNPDEYLKQSVDGRREAEYTEAYNVDKNTDEVEPKLDVLHADALNLGKKLDNVIARLDTVANKLDTVANKLDIVTGRLDTTNSRLNTANTYLSQIKENTDKDNNGNN